VEAAAIQDLFTELGPVRVRKMFGGQGIYFQDRMFALEIGGELYLKADEKSLPLFRNASSRAFQYEKHGKTQTMNYWLLPEEASDDPAKIARWGRIALAAAERANSEKNSKRLRRRQATAGI